MVEMMKVLTKMQESFLYVDDYVLQEHPDPQQARIAGNQEIIMSLVRRLASLF